MTYRKKISIVIKLYCESFVKIFKIMIILLNVIVALDDVIGYNKSIA